MRQTNNYFVLFIFLLRFQLVTFNDFGRELNLNVKLEVSTE